MTELAIANARIVTREEVLPGAVEVSDGQFAHVGSRPARPVGALDFQGDYLLPGLVELHTDNLERHFAPRPGVEWPGKVAALAHDSQLAAAGITTVFDAIFVGDDNAFRLKHLPAMVDAIRTAARWGAFRAEHFLHMRCELSCAGVLALFSPFLDEPLLRLVSLMDHTPGQRQFVDLEKHREYYQGRLRLTDAEMRRYVEDKMRARGEYGERNRTALLEALAGRDITLASHDDATPDHIDEAVRGGLAIAEFPTTVEAAEAARRNGMTILMGAPNLVLGGSHSGNVSALELAAAGLLDVLSSDYVPASVLQGIFILRDAVPGMTLPRAVALASANPARAVGLEDRGEVAAGKRADFIRVREIEGVAVALGAWREGRRVA